MKKLFHFSFFTLVVTLSLSKCCKAQWVTIPDSQFALWLQTSYPTCMNGNLMDTTCSDIVNETGLMISGLGIMDLTGVEYFHSLTTLDCSNNSISFLPTLTNSLSYLYCYSNLLTSLPPLPNSLGYLQCDSNPLSALPTLPNGLNELLCDYNLLTSLPSLPPFLIKLHCAGNSITSLPTLPNSLNELECQNNQLTSLPSLPNSVTVIYCFNNSLTGFSSIPNSLVWLDCYNNQIQNIPALPNSVIHVNCNYNQLTTLPVLSSSLQNLACSFNQLTALPLLPNSLTSLYCDFNQIISLPSLPSALSTLSCISNQITSLPALPNSIQTINVKNNLLSSLPALPNSILNLDCSINQITSLPSLPNALLSLVCDTNLISILPSLPNSLSMLICNGNQLNSLPSLPSSLVSLSCCNNQLISLPDLPSGLNNLICSNNQLNNLPAFPNSLYHLDIHDNPSILCLPPLIEFTGIASYFNISNTGIICLPNVIQHSLSIPEIDTMSVCNIFNTNECEVAWNINGNVRVDGDGNCNTLNDNIEISFVRMNLTDNVGNLIQQFIANWGGNFSFDIPLGNYTTSVDTVNFPFNILCPINNSINSNLTSFDSTFYNANFRLECKPGFDNGIWNVYRTNHLFPNDTTPIHFFAGDIVQTIYNVNCNSGISGEVKVVINGPANYLSPISGALTPTVTADTLIYSIADFSLVYANTDFAFNVITDSSALIGDEICFDVTVTPTANDNNVSNNTLTHCFAVSNSYDPNEKEVTPIGDLNYPFNNWLTYTIHFQNTGTASAQHIQILDTLDTDLDASTFQLLSSSFDPMVQLFGSKVKFNFVNINLPDSTTNSEGSKGYVSYRIKPLAYLPIGTDIENTASIYFDFNSPVVTNTTLNTVTYPLSAPTVTASLPQVNIYPNPVESQLTVNMLRKAQHDNYSITVTDILGRELLSVTPNQNPDSHRETILNLKSFSPGVYFVQVKTNEGVEVRKIVKN